MNGIKGFALVLIVAGVLAVVYGGFSYTKETHAAKIGPIELKVTEKENINVPLWMGLGVIAVGAALLVFGRKG